MAWEVKSTHGVATACVHGGASETAASCAQDSRCSRFTVPSGWSRCSQAWAGCRERISLG